MLTVVAVVLAAVGVVLTLEGCHVVPDDKLFGAVFVACGVLCLFTAIAFGVVQ